MADKTYEVQTDDGSGRDRKVTFRVHVFDEEDRRYRHHTRHGGEITVGLPDVFVGSVKEHTIPLDAFERFVYEHYGLRVSSSFQPDWVSPPVDSFKEQVSRRGHSLRDVAEMMEYSQEFVSSLLANEVRISEEVADRMGRVAGSKGFWLRREAHYLQALARMAHLAADAASGVEREGDAYPVEED